MGLFIFAILLVICGGLALLFGGLTDSPLAVRAVGAVAVIVALLLYVVSGLKSVPVKNIGVPQSFGSVHTGYYNSGIHQTWTPWLHLTDINETVQTTTFEGSNCLQVRIGGQQTACADITIQWRIKPSAAGSLFGDYANHGDLMSTIENAVVIRELKQVVNTQLGDYNPITDVQTVVNTNSATSQFSRFGPVILTTMQGDIGSRIDVLTVLMPFIHYDTQVEGKLNAIQQAYANYAIAQENVKVNQQQAAAYTKLGNPTLNQLVSECLTSPAQRPAGFQCFPGASSSLALSK